MFKEKNLALYWRSLLTETLPYEVPVIFSNEILYASVVKASSDPNVRKIVDCLRSRVNKYTVPYNYQISKDDTHFTTLGIIHPNQQMRIADFYENYKQSLIDYCSGSEITLRRPGADMTFFSETSMSEDEALKQGIPHIKPEDGEIDVSKMTSYFTYQRYNLLGKFIESQEFRELEKKFRLLRTLDVSKCFYHIYTHSITWAVKGKSYSKAQADTYSFESRFDRLMQRSNYNETNGIVVGPEISRIFAEIIFQQIDRDVVARLRPRRHNNDYAIRRYVDDYFIFASNKEFLDEITSIVRDRLEDFKLFVNAEKTSTATRPFVSKITLARSELASLISDMDACLDGLEEEQEAARDRKAAKRLRRLALDIRLISERYEVALNALSGWLLGTLRRLLRRSVAAIKAASSEDRMQAATQMTAALLEIAFYLAAMDMRVRTTYTVCQMITLIVTLDKPASSDSFDQLSHFVRDELAGLISSLLRRQTNNAEQIELFNLLIVGAQYFGSEFFDCEGPNEALESILSKPVSYFGFVTAKFCMLKNVVAYDAKLAKLNGDVRARLDEKFDLIGTEAELYMLACDYLSCPDVTISEKKTLVEKICGGQHSKAAIQEASRYLGFVDWDGMRIVHVLARRELRPVYSWS